MNENSKTFIIHIVFFNLGSNSTYSDKKAQITFLIAKKVKILNKYSDFANVFLKKKTLELSKQTKLNKHIIELENIKQPPYGLIHSLGLIELETLKMYIETYLKTGFI